MTKTHKIIAGVVALIIISLTAVFALNNNNGKQPSTTPVPTTGGAGGFTCSCCNGHGYMEAYMKAMAAELGPEESVCSGGDSSECSDCEQK